MVAYVIAGLVVVAIAVAAVVLFRRRSGTAAQAKGNQTLPPPTTPAERPMTGLEAALAQVTDSEGRPIGERIDAEAESVDELRVADDTGPLLRRALDRVEQDDSPEVAADDEQHGSTEQS